MDKGKFYIVVVVLPVGTPGTPVQYCILSILFCP
jgi:hypothetical protein